MSWVVLVRSIFNNDVDVFVAEGVTSREEADALQVKLAGINPSCEVEVVRVGSDNALQDLLFGTVEGD
jgi:hypothetical protein